MVKWDVRKNENSLAARSFSNALGSVELATGIWEAFKWKVFGVDRSERGAKTIVPAVSTGALANI